MSIKILLADDHAILRHGLSRSLSQQEGFDVVGQCSDGITAARMARELDPDLIIMDIRMPEMNGIEATREILRDFPKKKIIALSMHSSKRFVTEMFKAGANGYLLKDCEFDELLNAIHTVMDGKIYISPSVGDILVDNFIKPGGTQQLDGSIYSTLTKRERQVLQLLSEGKTTKQIARQLFISPKTVEAHRLNIMNKLDIDNVAQLTKYAIQEGITSPEI